MMHSASTRAPIALSIVVVLAGSAAIPSTALVLVGEAGVIGATVELEDGV